MIVLGIETAGPVGSVALFDPSGATRQTVLPATRQLGAELAPAIQRLLREAGLGPGRAPDLVAVDVGPGSYTGLRIGLAAAKGLAFAWGKPLLGVAAADALAALAFDRDPAPPRVLVTLDASRGQLHATSFVPGPDGPRAEGESTLWDPAILREGMARPTLVVGDAAEQVADAERDAASIDLKWPTAERVARVAYNRHMAGERQDALRLCPVYFHANEAEERRRKRARAGTA